MDDVRMKNLFLKVIQTLTDRIGGLHIVITALESHLDSSKTYHYKRPITNIKLIKEGTE